MVYLYIVHDSLSNPMCVLCVSREMLKNPDICGYVEKEVHLHYTGQWLIWIWMSTAQQTTVLEFICTLVGKI